MSSVGSGNSDLFSRKEGNMTEPNEKNQVCDQYAIANMCPYSELLINWYETWSSNNIDLIVTLTTKITLKVAHE